MSKNNVPLVSLNPCLFPQTVTNTIKKSWADGFREGSYIVEGRKLKIIGNIHPSGVGMNGNV
jgi:hypothetical protein